MPPEVELETKSVLKKVITASRALAELKGKANEIPNQLMLVNAITLQEAKDSSEIENIFTTQDELYQAFSARINAFDAQTREVLRYRQALLDGYQQLKKRPLSTNLFISIAETIKESKMGIRRIPGTTISNNNNVVYTPPEGEDRIRDLLHNLEEYIHSVDNTDDLIKLAVQHYQFEAIHPFHDGNGRTGRVINILYLVEKGLLNTPILYLSRYIIEHKQDYYSLLRNVTEKGAWEDWILFILSGIEETAHSTLNKIEKIHSLMNDTVERAKNVLPPRVYSKELIELLFEQPYCKVKFLVERGIAKRQTASEYLQIMEKAGFLKLQKVGKENLYLNISLYNILKD